MKIKFCELKKLQENTIFLFPNFVKERNILLGHELKRIKNTNIWCNCSFFASKYSCKNVENTIIANFSKLLFYIKYIDKLNTEIYEKKFIQNNQISDNSKNLLTKISQSQISRSKISEENKEEKSYNEIEHKNQEKYFKIIRRLKFNDNIKIPKRNRYGNDGYKTPTFKISSRKDNERDSPSQENASLEKTIVNKKKLNLPVKENEDYVGRQYLDYSTKSVNNSLPEIMVKKIEPSLFPKIYKHDDPQFNYKVNKRIMFSSLQKCKKNKIYHKIQSKPYISNNLNIPNVNEKELAKRKLREKMNIYGNFASYYLRNMNQIQHLISRNLYKDELNIKNSVSNIPETQGKLNQEENNIDSLN